MVQSATLPEVLTLEEAASYLRLSPETVARQAAKGHIPGQWVEGSWRFLHAALADWLRTRDYRALLLQQAGALADDDSLIELRAAIYKARGRPETDIDGAS
jgi:excisionase family DNA binding protein